MASSLNNYQEVIVDYLDKGIALVIADILSLITISSCLVIKVPQIQTIRKNKSSQGISTMGLCLELFSYTVMMSYNYLNDYNLLSYMEYPILLFQELILIYYTFKYKNLLNNQTRSAAAIYATIAFSIYYRIFPLMLLAVLVPFCTPIGATSKVLQLLAIIRSKDASSISRMTWALSAFTNLTRIYTICVESFDWMLLSNFLISTFLSSSVLAAACFYHEKPKSQ